uniref:Integrase catalytic domain-containing protein n=1 Tax=Fagus sylvatica TaxID=28930 RepID=A0A2N9GHZ2_FAGSY
MDSSTNSSLNTNSIQSPLSLLNNMSNLMSTKLDSTNYMIWKLQISALLDAYSVIEHLDGSIPQPMHFLTSDAGVQSVNPAFLAWKKKDKAILTLLYSTLTSPVLAMVIGLSTSQEVWNTLEERFTSTARANVLNLKLELQSIRKGNESMNSYLQRIKTTRDRLSAVGVLIDNEELLHIILKGLPKEYAPFASAIRTRDGILSLERLSVLLQTEEQSMKEESDPLLNSALAMFVSNTNKSNTSFSNSSYGSPSYGNSSSTRGRGRNSFHRGRGGRSSNFPQQPQSTQPQSTAQGRSERPTCQICWKQGHYAIDCYHRMDFAYQGKNPTTKLAAMASASNIQHTQSSAESWLTDSGASDHITATANNLNPQVPYQGIEQVSVGNGQNLPIQSIGNSQLHTISHKFQLKNVLHVPRIASNLLSVHKLCLHNNCSCHFDANKLLIQDIPTGKLLYKGLSKNGVYPIHSQLFSSASNNTACTAQSFSPEKWQLWHSRLGHPSARILTSLFPTLHSNFLSKNVLEHCHHCLAGKMHQLPFPISNKHAVFPFELVHADLWGPAPVVSTNAFRYYLVLVDDFTKFTWVYLLKNKSDTLTLFTQFRAMVETQFSLPIKALRSDCGGEFTSNQFNQFCASKGIIHQLSCPHTPQQNGVAERKHRHLVQCALALLSQSKLPMSYWSYAISTAAHLINRLPTPNLGHKLYVSRHVLFNENTFPGLKVSDSSSSVTQPAETWLNTLLTLHSCTHNLPDIPSSVQESSSLSHGHSTSCVNPSDIPIHAQESSSLPHGHSNPCDPLVTSTTLAPQHPTPLSTSLFPTNHTQSTAESPLQSAIPSPINQIPTDAPPLVCISPTVPQPLPPTHPMQTRSKSGIFKPKVTYAAQVDYTTTEPASYTPASKHTHWCTAMDEEFQALQKQGTWSLVPMPANKNVVGCKWVYKLKHNSDGTIARYKARLVAKGFHQQYGIDFAETFSPVIKPPTVRLILSLAVSLKWPLRQLDVKNAFLHGTLKEEVYMTQPQGYVDSAHPNYVCRLHKSIYGLKQAPRAWFESFTSQLLHLGFTASAADSSLFIYKTPTVIAYLLLYVDDIVLTSNTPSFLDHLIQQLSTVFDLKDLGNLHYFLGLQVSRTASSLFIRQTKYAQDLLKRHNMLDCKAAPSPCCPNTRLSLHAGDPLPEPHGLPSTCQHLHPTHLAAAKRILRYIRGTVHHGIEFTPGPLTLSAYTDADWAGDPDDRRSTSGFLIYLGSNAITWSAKKQPTVSRSSTESEYRALAFASAELCWVRTLLKDLGIYIRDPPILWCDNVSALAIASNPVFHARTKHIEVDFHFVRERVLRKDLTVKFVSTVDQLADIFTKSLSTHRFLDLRNNLTVPVPVRELEGG